MVGGRYGKDDEAGGFLMGRPAVPASVTRITLHVPEDWVIPSEGKRYVFMDLITPLATKTLKEHEGDKKMADRFCQHVHRGQYNLGEKYGLPVIDIDDPNRTEVSLPLKISVGKGRNTVKAVKRGGST
jgi:hypothetical protein